MSAKPLLSATQEGGEEEQKQTNPYWLRESSSAFVCNRQ